MLYFKIGELQPLYFINKCLLQSNYPPRKWDMTDVIKEALPHDHVIIKSIVNRELQVSKVVEPYVKLYLSKGFQW